jgi:heterodisulfide reductase subunit B
MTPLRYLYFPGCKISPFLPEYDHATLALLATLGIDLADAELNCCGYPVRDVDFTAAMFSATRILATAAQKGLPLLTPCKCCYGNLMQAKFWMHRSAGLRERAIGLLAEEGLRWSETVVVRHLLTALKEDLGLDRLRAAVNQPLQGYRVAVHYGCHALRPGDVTRFDNPLAPTVFEAVVETTGAIAVPWPLRLECCGYPLWEKNNALALALMQRKLADASESGAQALITACTYCQLQFGAVREQHLQGPQAYRELPSILVSQLLGTALGLPDQALGLKKEFSVLS